jgi:ubiquinone biosynthesis protein UbiJ
MNSLVISTLQNTLNFTLDQDPQKSHILKLTKYKILLVNILDWNLKIIFVPEEDSIKVLEKLPNEEASPDCILSGKLFDLITLSVSENAQQIIQSNKVTQTGDLHVLQDYQTAIKAFQFDLPQQVKEALGPNLTQLFISPIKGITNWLSNSFDSTKKDITEYAQEESQLLPPTEEVKDFFDDVQELSLRLDRLSAQINEYIESITIKDNV